MVCNLEKRWCTVHWNCTILSTAICTYKDHMQAPVLARNCLSRSLLVTQKASQYKGFSQMAHFALVDFTGTRKNNLYSTVIVIVIIGFHFTKSISVVG